VRTFEKFARSDASLLRGYAKGDSAAFEKLYARHKDALYNYIFRSLGQFAAAEEIAQEVWMVVIARAEKYESRDAAFKTWLYTIGRNKVIDFQRRRANQAYDSIEDAGIADASLSSEQQVLLQQLMTALDQLPAEQREAFVLQQEGFSQREICKITGAGSETVKSRLRYARTSLKQRLGET
jgi:RNA polymerase sigma-70 factor (ECF subfamily)